MRSPAEAPVYFHIGLPRTGTTWLQEQVFPRLRGLRYTDISPQRNWPALIQPMIRLVDWCEGRRGRLAWLRRMRLRAAFPRGPLLLSNENHFTGMPATPSSPDRRGVLASLLELWPGLRLVVVLRRQTDMIASLYRHRVRIGPETATFEEYLQRFGDDLTAFLEYDEFIRDLRQAVGEERVWIGLYEDFRNHREAFLADLTGWMNADLPGSIDTAGQQDPSSSRNASLPWSAIPDVLEINRAAIAEKWANEARVQAIVSLKSDRGGAAPMFDAALIERFQSANRLIAETVTRDFERGGYFDLQGAG